MPELPEVETVRRGLVSLVKGYKIVGAHDLHPRALKPESIAPLKSIQGAKIIDLNRRGKFLWFVLDRPQVLVAHLGMSGQFLIHQQGHPRAKHVRAQFDLTKQMRKRELVFNDQRTFGWLSVEEINNGVPTSASHIAYDPFEPEFNLNQVVAKIRAKKSSIKSAILNQEVVSGIGNIYADESLWRAKIHPEIICEDLSENEIKKIISSAASVMKSAIKAGGTSFDEQYKNVNGESGYFSRSLSVYGRQGEPCSRCGAPIARIAFVNRSSHFCPRCQR